MVFDGAKLAILVGDRVVSILRDDLVGLDHANHWDLPGGGREKGETPQDCVLREVREELGLTLAATDLHEAFACASQNGLVWFFVSKQREFDASLVRFGDEGQRWDLVTTDWFLNEALAVPVLQTRLRNYLETGHPCG